jgi:succinoglycan biosynthesis transport protein ExoP
MPNTASTLRTPLAAAPPPPSADSAISSTEAITLGDVLDVLSRRRLLTMATGLGVATMVFLIGVMRTPLFDAQATITLNLSEKAVEFSSQQSNQDQNEWSYAHDLLNTQRNILQSRDLLLAALRTGGLSNNQGYASNSDALDRLRSRFSVATSRDSWDLTLTLRDEDPNRAEAGLQSILDTYKSRYTESLKDRAESSISFLDDQLAEAKRKMEQSRDLEHGFQESKGLVVLDPERSLAAQRLIAINAKAVMLSQQLAAVDILVEQIGKCDTIADPELRLNALLGLDLVNRHPTVIEQQRLLFELRTKEAELGQKYLANHPRMLELRSQIAEKLSQVQQSVMSIRNGVISDRAKLASQLLSLKDEKSRNEVEFNAYRLDLFRLQTLTQETKANEQLYDHLLKRLGEVRIAQHLDQQQLSVTDAPNASSQPVNIHASLSALLATFIGAFCGVLVPLTLEFFSTRANSKADVQGMLEMPLLSEIPYIPDLPSFGAHGDPNLPEDLTEAVRGLRTSLRMRQPKSDVGDCILITSSDQGDGKSTIAVRLAMSMAQSGQKVLLIDGNLRDPSLHLQLEQTCERGLSRLLAGEPGITPSETTYANLSFMDAGERIAQPGEILNSHCLAEWLQQCRTQFDAIIIDSPSLNLCADALILGECTDRILLVVREGMTHKDNLARTRQALAPLADRIAGFAMVCRPGLLTTQSLYRQFFPGRKVELGTAADAKPPRAKAAS